MQHGSISKQYGDGAASRRDRHHHHHHRHRDRDNTEEEEEEDDNNGCRRSSRDGTKTKLTAEEEQLYAKAKEFLKRNDEADENIDIDKEEEDRRHHHRHHRKHLHSVDRHRRHHHREDDKRHRHRRSSRKDDYEDDDDDDSDERRRSRRHRREEKSKKHKHSRRNHHSHRSHHGDDNHDNKDEDRRQKKRNKRTHTTSSHKPIYTGDEEFKNKSSPIDSTVHLVPLGNILGNPPIDGKKLDAESDYFSYNAHLRLYLYRTYGIYFEDLTSVESHCAFAEFTKLYNAGMLEEAYYSTDSTNSNNLPQEAVEQCSRTKHKWTFRTNQLEEQSLQLVRAGVKKQTEYTASTADHGIGRSSSSSSIYTTTGKLGGSIGTEKATDPTKQNTTTVTTPNPQRQQLEYAQTVASRQQADKAHSERIKLANEEIHGITSGKADTGWERMREKKRERSEKLHGAHRERESEGWELNDDDIYGTSTSGGIVAGGGKRRSGGSRGDVSFEEAIAKERQFRERKEAESEARRAGLLEKEAERQKKMFEALGLSGMMKPGEKITIAPRNDTPG